MLILVSKVRFSAAAPLPEGMVCDTTIEKQLLYAPLYYKMPFLPYEAFHSVRGCLQRTAAPKGQMICNDCCRHLFQGALPPGYEPDGQRNLSPVSNSFAVYAFRDLILPPFSAFFTEKKLRKHTARIILQ